MWVYLRILLALDLDRGVEQIVLASTQVSHVGQSLQGLLGLDMHAHARFANVDLPNVQIMNIDNITCIFMIDVLNEGFCIDVVGGTLHDYAQTLLDSGHRGKHDHDRENEGTQGVEPPERRGEPNYCCSHDDTD